MNKDMRSATNAVAEGPAVSKGRAPVRRLNAIEIDGVHGGGGKLGLSGGSRDGLVLAAHE